MCELLGFSSSKAEDVRTYLTAFYAHSVKHPHGWGLMRETYDGKTEIFKEGVCAAKSTILGNLIAETLPQKHLLAHIRLATVGSVRQENCHPFCGTDRSGRHWTLIHNGTIYSGKKLIPYRNLQTGDTDSERVFLCLMDEIHGEISRQGALSAQQRFQIIDNMVTKLSPRNKLNLMLFDGEVLYVHKNMKHTLFYKQSDHSVVFSTQPLDDSCGWQPFPMTQLLAYKDGKQLFSGTVHGNVFVPSREYITAMDAMHI
jgi:glutamine amidotransferase